MKLAHRLDRAAKLSPDAPSLVFGSTPVAGHREFARHVFPETQGFDADEALDLAARLGDAQHE